MAVVTWNQWAKPLNADNYRAYNSDNLSVSFDNGVATQTWLIAGKGGYHATFCDKNTIAAVKDEVWYVSYELNPSMTNGTFSFDGVGMTTIPPGIFFEPNTWGRLSLIVTAEQTKNSRTGYIANLRNSGSANGTNPNVSVAVGDTVQVRNFLCINLTQMYGAGNEPLNVKTFELECLINGISLTTYQEYNTTGTQREWKRLTGSLMESRRRIAMNNPHIVSVASGNTPDSDIISWFKTDISAPFKSCRIDFEPIQEGSNDPSPTNIRPISGRNTIKLTRCGKNLLHVVNDGRTASGLTYVFNRNQENEVTSINITGTTDHAQDTGNFFTNLQYNPGDFNLLYGTYRFSVGNESTYAHIVYSYKYNDGDPPYNTQPYTRSITTYGSNNYSGVRVQIVPYKFHNGEVINDTIYPMYELDSVATCVFEPYHGNTYTIQLPDTYYGGYIDLAKGIGVQTWAYETLVWGDYVQEVHRVEGYTVRRFSLSNTPVVEQSNVVSSICDKAKYYLKYTYEGGVNQYTINSSSRAHIQMPDGTPDNTTFQFCYMLATPIEFSISPQVVKTYKGINNVWSPDGTVSLKYWTH